MKKVNYILKLLFLTCVVLGGSNSLYADLKYIPLSLELSSTQHVFVQGELMQFNLKFTNRDTKKNAIILPGKMHKGNKLIYFTIYTVKDDFYTEIYRENRTINMESLSYNQSFFYNLGAKSSVTIPIFFNDSINYKRQIEAHHTFPPLTPGHYEIRAWYNPWSDPLAKNAFTKVSDIDKLNTAVENPTKSNLQEEGLISNCFKIQIVENKIAPEKKLNTSFCPSNCKLCRAIEKSNWQKVASIIDDQTFYTGKENKQFTDSSWLQPHQQIAFIYPKPETILSSLPSFTSRKIIFRNKNGFHYFLAKWQIGIIYRGRSRLNSFLYWMTKRNRAIKSSEVDYFKLIYFEPV